MIKSLLKCSIAAFAVSASIATAHAADWKPAGPIKLMIAFRAGGGVDTQARLIAEELTARHGWKIIPENLAGKGGAIMARALKKQPADGLAIGMTVSESLTYTPSAVRKAGFALKDFTMLTSTSGSQVALFAKASRGWKNLGDVIAAAKSGKKITLGAISPKLTDGAYLIAKENKIKFSVVRTKGGKGALNGVLADDLDVAWGAGPQNKGVAAGDLVNLVSAEGKPLAISPGAPLLKDYGVPYILGSKFMFIAPAGLPDNARKAITEAIVAIVKDPKSKVNGLITKRFGGVQIIAGQDLQALMDKQSAEDKKLLEAAAQ